jgi:para-aminobenzoate synthetase/4-amino-4-deoxychorismate lyase
MTILKAPDHKPNKSRDLHEKPADRNLPYVLIRDSDHESWLEFSSPVHIFSTFDHAEIPTLMEEIELRVQCEGLYAVGFLSYEAGAAFDAVIPVVIDPDIPLMWFGLYPDVRSIELTKEPKCTTLKNWQPSIDKIEYTNRLKQIKEFIASGNSYQVNFTYRLITEFNLDPWQYSQAILVDQDPPYGAYLETKEWAICSASPELFFKVGNGVIESHPMKGTMPRGLTFQDDQKRAQDLHLSKKDRAENSIIVDIVRNDLARIAPRGAVCVPELFRVERYRDVWQMLSIIRAQTSASLKSIFKALFPAASITGGPKLRTIQIIAELESTPRKIYTGAIGIIRPDRSMQFNVAIRTLLIDKVMKTAEYGTGGGITWDSVEKSEWQESLNKARVIFEHSPDFQLLETILWTPNNSYDLIDRHLQRLSNSAKYFNFRIDLKNIRKHLLKKQTQFPSRSQRVRLLVNRNGTFSIENQIFKSLNSRPVRVRLAATPVDSGNRFLYHKTSHRQVYSKARADQPDCDDVLLYNEKGEVTEATISNFAYEMDGILYTPPQSCGLLDGCYRAELIAHGQLQERPINIAELSKLSQTFLMNSVHKLYQMKLVI